MRILLMLAIALPLIACAVNEPAAEDLAPADIAAPAVEDLPPAGCQGKTPVVAAHLTTDLQDAGAQGIIPIRQYNATGTPNRVLRRAVGVYDVQVAGLDGCGNIQVTARDTASFCSFALPETGKVLVSCFKSINGIPLDTPFSFVYFR